MKKMPLFASQRRKDGLIAKHERNLYFLVIKIHEISNASKCTKHVLTRDLISTNRDELRLLRLISTNQDEVRLLPLISTNQDMVLLFRPITGGGAVATAAACRRVDARLRSAASRREEPGAGRTAGEDVDDGRTDGHGGHWDGRTTGRAPQGK